MEELVAKLENVPDSYFGFVAGVVAYAKTKPDNLKKVLRFLNDNPDLSSSEILRFVVTQPDFHDYGLGAKQRESVG